MKTIQKRFWSLLLVVAVVLSILPATAFAAIGDTELSKNGDTKTVDATSASGGLTTDTETLKEAGAFGFAATQPVKTDSQGNPVDKTKSNPLGAPVTSINRILNLAVSGFQLESTKKGLTTYANPSYKNFVYEWGNIVANSTSTFESYYNNDVKAMTGADLNGDGRQENVTLVLKPKGTNNALCDAVIIVRNYDIAADKKTSGGSTETVYALDNGIRMPDSTVNSGVEYPIGIVSGDFDHDGKDELALNIGNLGYTLHSDNNFKLTRASKKIFSKSVQVGKSMFTVEAENISLASADANNDGFKDILVTSTFPASSSGSKSILWIYNSNDFNSSCKAVDLSFNTPDGKSGTYFTTPSADVGDVYGDGNRNIVVGGKASDGKIYIASSGYDPETGTYSSLSDNCYEIGFSGKGVGHNPSNMWGVVNKASLSLKCVSLMKPTPGAPQWIVLGGTLYYFDKSNGKFVKKEVKSRQYSSGGAFAYSPGNSDGLLDITCDGDGIGNDGHSYILNTVVGNFDGNTEGREQIIMLHYDNLDGSNKERVVITYCSVDKDGNISTLNTSIRPINSSYMYPAISAPDVYGKSTRLIYQPEKSSFVFSKPTVIAVLGAAPYYKEIAERDDDYAGNLGNMSTSLGQSSESGLSTSNGLNVNVGVSFGFQQEQSILGVYKIAEEEFKTTLSYAFTATWTSSKSISKGITYQNNMSMRGSDSAVVMVVPCDIFSYKVIGPDGKTSEMTINVPYEPQTVQMPISRYNQIVTENKIEGAPVIGPEVLNHTPGDPRTYPETMKDIDGAKAGALLSGSKAVDLGTNFQAEQTIAITTSQEKSFEHSLDISIEVNVNVMGITAGASAGTGYVRSEAKTTSQSTEVTGSVRGLPGEYTKNGYGFSWQLAFYNYNLEVPGSTRPQTCYVVSYLLKPQNSNGYPPYIPQNVKASSQGQDSVLLTWDKVSNGSGYRISRSETAEGGFVKIGDIQGSASTSFTDKTVKSGKTYYYKVRAYNVSDGLDCDAVSGYPLPVSGIAVASSPKLSYNPGDKLDLSALSASLIFSDNSTKTVAFKDFEENNLSVSTSNGTKLSAANDRKSIIVTYSPDGSSQYKTASAGQLTVRLVKDVQPDILPKMHYTAGDTLDLTQLTVMLEYNDDTHKEVAFSDFASNQLTVSISNGKVLDVPDSGTSLTVTYNGATSAVQPITTGIGELTVYKKGTSGVLLSADFTVGGQKNARTLSPNQQLTANIKVTNTQEEAQDALVLLVLYNENGSMVKMASGTVSAGARSGTGGTKSLTLGFTLPKDTNSGYKVRVFAWGGTSLSKTDQVPISNILQMP